LPSITESAEELQRRLRAEKDARKRQRLQALYLLATGQATSRLAVAELLAVHRHTVRAWLAAYERGGLRALLTIHQAPGKGSALSPVVRAKLQARLQQPHGFGSYREIQQYLATDHRVRLAYSTVHGVVRSQLQASPQSPRRSHPKKISTRSPSFNTPSRLGS
jgi:transposase